MCRLYRFSLRCVLASSALFRVKHTYTGMFLRCMIIFGVLTSFFDILFHELNPRRIFWGLEGCVA